MRIRVRLFDPSGKLMSHAETEPKADGGHTLVVPVGDKGLWSNAWPRFTPGWRIEVTEA